MKKKRRGNGLTQTAERCRVQSWSGPLENKKGQRARVAMILEIVYSLLPREAQRDLKKMLFTRDK